MIMVILILQLQMEGKLIWEGTEAVFFFFLIIPAEE